MKTILLLSALLFSGCVVYIQKFDCPQRDTVIIKNKENIFWEDRMPIFEKIKEYQDSLYQEWLRSNPFKGIRKPNHVESEYWYHTWDGDSSLVQSILD